MTMTGKRCKSTKLITTCKEPFEVRCFLHTHHDGPHNAESLRVYPYNIEWEDEKFIYNKPKSDLEIKNEKLKATISKLISLGNNLLASRGKSIIMDWDGVAILQWNSVVDEARKVRDE